MDETNNETSQETRYVYVIVEHDIDESATEVVAVVDDDSEVALAALWGALHQRICYLDDEEEQDDAWYERYAHHLTLHEDGSADLEYEGSIWHASRHEVQS